MTKPIPDAKIGGKGGAGFNCPVCHGPGRARSSYRLSHLTKRVHYMCQDELCGHTWSCMIEFERTLSPSAHGPVDRNAPFLKLKPRPALPPIGGIQPLPAPPEQVHPPPDRP